MTIEIKMLQDRVITFGMTEDTRPKPKYVRGQWLQLQWSIRGVFQEVFEVVAIVRDVSTEDIFYFLNGVNSPVIESQLAPLNWKRISGGFRIEPLYHDRNHEECEECLFQDCVPNQCYGHCAGPVECKFFVGV